MTLTRAYLLVIQEEKPKSVSLKPEEESQNEAAKPGFWLEREGQHEASRITPAYVGRRWNTSFDNQQNQAETWLDTKEFIFIRDTGRLPSFGSVMIHFTLKEHPHMK